MIRWKTVGVQFLAFGAFLAFFELGCSDDGDGGLSFPISSTNTRFDLLEAGSESSLREGICTEAGLGTNCDVCEALGFYGDMVCDQPLIDSEWCTGPDPDCTATHADLYVASDGDDTGSGSEEDPLATLVEALNRSEPGFLIYLRGGILRPTDETRIRVEGTAEAPIVIQTYPGEKVTIDASGLPDGDINGGSTPTWNLDGAKHLQFIGPIHLTNGRGAGVLIQEDTHFIDFIQIESSYNGQRAARAGHGFLIVETQWADVQNVKFINCDAHNNTNHRARDGEDVAENQYQHGDGWRIKSGREIELVGCRAWNNLDDGYDLVWATHPVSMVNCWAAYTGRDDDVGSLTGVPNLELEWGEGIKLSYDSDTGQHSCIRCLSWRNVHLGFRLDGGPNALIHCASFQNGRRALGWDLGSRSGVL